MSGAQLPRTTMDGRAVISLSSNNYLGLATHPHLVESAERAVRELGVGSGAVRTIAGTMDLHEELERRLAEFKHTEATLVFQSGFTANSGVIPTITTDQDLIDFVIREARLIDMHRLDEWLELFTDDGIYWMPLEWGQTDPRLTTSLMDNPLAAANVRTRRTRLCGSLTVNASLASLGGTGCFSR